MPEVTKEREAAEVLSRLSGFLDEIDVDELKGVSERMRTLTDIAGDDFKGLDPKKVDDQFESIKAEQKAIRDAIRNSRKGAYVSGIEDYSDKFSMIRAINHMRGKGGGDLEVEIMQQARAKAAQAMGEDTVGGYFVPDQVIPEVIGEIFTSSVLIGLENSGATRATVLDGLIGGKVSLPKFNGGMIAYWGGEAEEVAESNVTTGMVDFDPKLLTVLARFTASMLKFQGYGFEQRVRTSMGRAIAKKLDLSAMYGTGGNQGPRGVFNHPDIKVFRTGAGAFGTVFANHAAAKADADGTAWVDGKELTFDMLHEMQGALEDDDVMVETSHGYITSPKAIRNLKRVKVDNFSGQNGAAAPYLVGIPVLPDSRMRDLIGDFDTSTQILNNKKPGQTAGLAADGGATAVHTDVLSGNLSEIGIARWSGIEISDDGGKGKHFTSNETLVKMQGYFDVNVFQPRGLVGTYDAKVS